MILSFTEMPFNATIGSTVNCGFCRTLVYECLAVKKERKDSKSKNSQSKLPESHGSGSMDSSNTPVDGKKSQNYKVCVVQCFKALFSGSQFEMGDKYFDKGESSRESNFERHCIKVQKPFSLFRTVACKQRYMETFSSANWEALPSSKKASHSLSNCVSCCYTVCRVVIGIFHETLLFPH